MSKKTKVKKKTKAPKDPLLTARHKRFAIGLLVAFGGIGTFVGASAGLRLLNERAVSRLTPGSPVVTVAWPRDSAGKVWMPNAERERLATMMVHAAEGGRALSREPLEDIGAVLSSTGWFEGTPTVRWTHDATIQARGRWRTPVAVVRLGEMEYLIDHDAQVLPLNYPAGQSNQIYLVNPSQPLPGEGKQWEGEDIRSALDLMLLLQKEDLLGQVAGFDLGEGREAGRLSIITDRDSRVIWGGGPQHTRPGEQPTNVKLTRIKTLLKRTGRIDGAVDRIDLRGPQILLERNPT